MANNNNGNNNNHSRKSRKVEYVPKKQYQIMKFFVGEYQKNDSIQGREERAENRKLYGLPLTDMELYSNFNLFKGYLDKVGASNGNDQDTLLVPLVAGEV